MSDVGPYHRLGEYLQKAVPYGLDVTLPEPFEGNPDIKIAGVAAANNANNPFPKRSDQLTDAEQFRCLWWYFPDERQEPEMRRVTKAIRMPIQFVRASDGQTVKAAIVIGFEGPGD